VCRLQHQSQHRGVHQQSQQQLLPWAVGQAAGVHARAVHHPRGDVQEPAPLPPLLGGPSVLHRLQDRSDGLHHDCGEHAQVYSGIHGGNTEQGNNGYVVFKWKRKRGGTRRGKALLRPPTSLYTAYQISGRIYEDDVNRSSSASDICFIVEPHSNWACCESIILTLIFFLLFPEFRRGAELTQQVVY